MAKIGTAHVEIKPVLNEEALEAISAAVEDAVARGVERGMANRSRVVVHNHHGFASDLQRTHEQMAADIDRFGARDSL